MTLIWAVYVSIYRICIFKQILLVLQGDFNHCRNNVNTNLRLEFSCDSSCAQNEFTFQYRVVLESLGK